MSFPVNRNLSAASQDASTVLLVDLNAVRREEVEPMVSWYFFFSVHQKWAFLNHFSRKVLDHKIITEVPVPWETGWFFLVVHYEKISSTELHIAPDDSTFTMLCCSVVWVNNGEIVSVSGIDWKRPLNSHCWRDGDNRKLRQCSEFSSIPFYTA